MPMTINKFNLQFFNDGQDVFGEDAPAEEVIDEVIDTPVDESDVSEPEVEQEEQEEQEPDFSDANKEFLDRFKVQFDGKDKQYESMEQLIEDAQQGGALPRYKEKVTKYENNPLYKYIDNYMKDSGYEDPQTFVNDMNINTKMQDYINKGMSEEDAKEAATEYVGKGQPSVDIKSKEIDSFLSWHQSKVETGKFEGELDTNNIPDAVLKAYEGGMSLKEAYLDYVLDDIKVKTEQKTIKNIAKNKETSAGKLDTSLTNTTKNLTPAQIDKTLGSMSQKEQSKWIDANYDLIEKSGYFKQ